MSISSSLSMFTEMGLTKASSRDARTSGLALLKRQLQALSIKLRSTPKLNPEIAVHLPVPFCPALSLMSSTSEPGA